MADKADKKPDAAPSGPKREEASKPAAPGSKGGLMTKTPVLLGGVMIVEAVVLFAGFKFLGGGHPQSAVGAELAVEEHGSGHGEKGAHGTQAGDKRKCVEIQVLQFRAPNKLSGRTFLYDVEVFAVTRTESADVVKAAITDRGALIKDRIRTIIAQTDPEKLGGGSEPGLETLRRQVKYQLDQIVGEGLIDEVLIPKCIPFRTDY